MRLSSLLDPAILLCAFTVATLGCQSAQKSSSFVPPQQAQAPAIHANASSATSPQTAPATLTKAADAQHKSDAAKPAAPDPVADLLARVEKEYLAGQAAVQSSSAPSPNAQNATAQSLAVPADDHDARLEAARQHFTTALNLLLHSGFNLDSDQRLQAELDRVLDGINSIELESALIGDALPEQKSEPAPIDEANEVTPPVDLNVKAKAEAEIKSTHSDLPLMMTDQVAGYINYFSTRGRGVFERALARSGRYEDMIRHTLRQEGVPQDLIYLAQSESGFHPLAVSRAGARGMWQFMASRGRAYGLERSWWVDERQDPEKATRAAAHHLKDLYDEFGDWYLAMAAYNSGPGTVQNAVKRTGYADFWQLYKRNVLPRETRNYVPIIVAVTIMAKNPDQYGLADVVKEKPVAYDTIKIDYPIDLRLVADCVDAAAADLQDLNPSLLRLTTPKIDGNKGFELHLPAGTAAMFASAVASIPIDKRIWWRYHKVRDGETLASIAHTYHSSVASITAVNDLESSDLAPEMRLIIPIAPGKVSDSTTYARAITRYRIRKGDTVESVAENFGVSPKMIRVWNRMKGNSLAGRRILLVHLPVTPNARETQMASAHVSRHTSSMRASNQTSPAKSHATQTAQKQSAAQSSQGRVVAQAGSSGVVHHKVKPGETLYSIASSYNTTVAALKHDNRNITNIAILRPGMILIIRDVQ